MIDRRNPRAEEAASIGRPAGPFRLAPIPGLVLDGPFTETKELAYAAPAPCCGAQAGSVDLRCAAPVGSARRGAS